MIKLCRWFESGQPLHSVVDDEDDGVQKFRHKETGEIVTQVPMLEIGDYEKVEDGD